MCQTSRAFVAGAGSSRAAMTSQVSCDRPGCQSRDSLSPLISGGLLAGLDAGAFLDCVRSEGPNGGR